MLSIKHFLNKKRVEKPKFNKHILDRPGGTYLGILLGNVVLGFSKKDFNPLYFDCDQHGSAKKLRVFICVESLQQQAAKRSFLNFFRRKVDILPLFLSSR